MTLRRRALLDLLSGGEEPGAGRQRLYRFHPEQLGDVAGWVRQHYERFWRERPTAKK